MLTNETKSNKLLYHADLGKHVKEHMANVHHKYEKLG